MAKTFGTGADPKGLVARGVEGSGAAQIFRPSQAVQDFVTRQARGEQQRAAEKKAEAKAKADRQKEIDKYAIKADVATFTQPDNEEALSRLNKLQGKLAELKVLGIDPRTDASFQAEEYAFNQFIDNIKNERESYEKGVANFIAIAKDPNYEPEQITDFAIRLQNYRDTPTGERYKVDTSPPQKPLIIDIPKIINDNINIGYFEDTDLDEQGIGVASKTVKQNDLLSQSKALVEANDKLYNEGIRKGLWGDKEEAAKWVSNFKLWQADTSVKDIFRSTAQNNVFGSGANETQVNEDFQKWKTDLFSGNENAAAYLFGVKLPSGEALKRNKLLPSRGKQTAGAIYEYETESTATTVDGTKVRSKGKFEFAPQAMNEQELYKFYLQSLEDRKRTYGMDLSKKSSGTSFIQSSSQSATPTTTKPSGTSAKKPKPY